MAGVPYVGAGVLGSAVGMDKAVQKVLFAAAGLPIVEHEVVREREWDEDPEGVEARVGRLGYPLFAEAGHARVLGRNHQGPPTRASSGPRCEEAFRYARKAVVERGRRATLARSSARCSATTTRSRRSPARSSRRHEFYDYEAKYLDEHGARLEIPADISPR